MFGRIFGDGTEKPVEPYRVVRGQLHVAGGEPANLEYVTAKGWWTGVLTGPGLTPAVVTHAEAADTDRWPERGQVLPVEVTLSTPVRLRIVWKQVPTRRERALADAEALLKTLA